LARFDRTFFRTILLLGLIGVGIAGLVSVTRHAPPVREVSDRAILEIYALQALEGKLLVGPYSRFGWHHPGPLYFYVAAPWYWMSGHHAAGLQAGALAINLGAVAAIAWTAARFAPAPIAFAVAVVTAWYTFRTGDLIVSVESSRDRSADARVRRHRCRPGCDWTPSAAAVDRPVRVVSGANP
jgi:hypothetical protein